eukprot:scaffold565_cov358-Prasinococcus_capsulatus_cf.AAC.9
MVERGAGRGRTYIDSMPHPSGHTCSVAPLAVARSVRGRPGGRAAALRRGGGAEPGDEGTNGWRVWVRSAARRRCGGQGHESVWVTVHLPEPPPMSAPAPSAGPCESSRPHRAPQA